MDTTSDCQAMALDAPVESTELGTSSCDDTTSIVPKLEALDALDEAGIALMSPERKAWVEYRVDTSVPKRKRRKTTTGKLDKADSTPTLTTTLRKRNGRAIKENVHSRSVSVDLQSLSAMNLSVSPGAKPDLPPRKIRPANIYEDENGGKRRRPSHSKVNPKDGFAHTSIVELEGNMQKQRCTPDYASSDSGLGLLSPPYGSRSSESPEFTSPDIIKPSDLLYDRSANTDFVTRNEFNIHSLPSYDSSDDELPKSRTAMRKNPRMRIPSRKSLLSQSQDHVAQFKRPKLLKSAIEAHESDYTDFSDLERDSDTPVYELLVDSEDEDDHKRRKLARRERKAAKRERLRCQPCTSAPLLSICI